MRTILIIEGNVGIGYYSALELAYDFANQIYITGSDRASICSVISDIREITGNEKVYCYQLDLTDWKSIYKFCHALVSDGIISIDILINNACIIDYSQTKYTKEGFEWTFAYNYIGSFILINGLLTRLTHEARIMNVCGYMYNPIKCSDFQDPLYPTFNSLAYPIDPLDSLDANWFHIALKRYNYSQLCKLLYTAKLSSILSNESSGITVNGFDPGIMPEILSLDSSNAFQRGFKKMLFKSWSLFDKRLQSPESSGKYLASLVLSNEFTSLSGRIFSITEYSNYSSHTYDRHYQNDLWNSTLEQCKSIIDNIKKL